MTAVGTKDSGWQTEFFSLQMAAKRGGRTLKEIGGDESKNLIVNDHKFMAQFAKINASFAASKATMKTLQGQQDALKTEIAALEEQINRSGGTDANGKTLDRSDVQQAMLEKMYEVDRQNDPLKFENHYYKTIYEPALAACQKKAVCDAGPLRAAQRHHEPRRPGVRVVHDFASLLSAFDDVDGEPAARGLLVPVLHVRPVSRIVLIA